MEHITGGNYDEERAFYGRSDLMIENASFAGPADGESAFKECNNIIVKNTYFDLRYPFWHVDNLKIADSSMTANCRAALWYSSNITITDTKMYGIKALRECSSVTIRNSDIISPEFGWSVNGVNVIDSNAESEYFLMRSKDIVFENVTFKGKYSFQYMENGIFKNCNFDTKDAFWHAKNVVVMNSTIKGEYLAWYSDGLTLIDSTIIGTQPLCYAKNLKLINCRMIGTDLSFEKSDVMASITTPVESIKNPRSGVIEVPSVGKMINDDENAKGKVVIKNL